MLNALIIASAVASFQAAAPNDEIVVTGQKPLDRAEAQKAVNAVATSKESQIGRFHEPVCPLVVGLPMQAREVVESQIRGIARQVGAPLASAKCTANLVVILAGDADAMFSDIRKNRPEWLNGLTHRDVEKVVAQKGPVRAWSVTSLRNEDGRMVQASTDGKELPTVQVRSASILNQTMRQQMDGSVIIIERAALDGRTLGEIAHYAAMRGLAMTRPPEGEAFGTILGMFNSASGPRSLTRFDLNYLKALYAGNGRELAVQERSRIAKAVARRSD